uniref:Uncharacterized protein n=1 Tax=Proboscia inermis TaxID=420281 RepID=A0A7S0GI06_9STRA
MENDSFTTTSDSFNMRSRLDHVSKEFDSFRSSTEMKMEHEEHMRASAEKSLQRALEEAEQRTLEKNELFYKMESYRREIEELRTTNFRKQQEHSFRTSDSTSTHFTFRSSDMDRDSSQGDFLRERELRLKAEEMCAALAERAKASLERRDAQFLELKLRMTEITSQKDSTISALAAERDNLYHQKSISDELVASVSNNARHQLLNQSITFDDERRTVGDDSVTIDALELESLRGSVKRQESVNQDQQAELESSRKELKKYKLIQRSAQGVLKGLTDQLSESEIHSSRGV